MNLADFIKDWRKNAGITQATAAQALQMALPTYQGIEQGRPFKYEHLLRLAVQQLEGTK